MPRLAIVLGNCQGKVFQLYALWSVGYQYSEAFTGMTILPAERGIIDPRPARTPALPIRQRRGYVTELSKQNIKLV